MEATEKKVILILADISGYTRFMVANQTAAVHGQGVITKLLETILAEVEIPLTLHGIEGDAVFLSAAHPGDEEGWQNVLAEVRAKLVRFFEVFLQAVVRVAESTPCGCVACRNVDGLKLKVVVHSGTAVFHTIAGLPQIAGTDVILAHRLLKNSVPSDEYLLMSEAAWRELGNGMPGDFQPGEEQCEGIGPVKTMVRMMGPAREKARDDFLSKPEAELAELGRTYPDWMKRSVQRGLVEQLKHPTSRVSLPGRLLHAASLLLKWPGQLRTWRRAVPELLLRKRAEHLARTPDPGAAGD